MHMYTRAVPSLHNNECKCMHEQYRHCRVPVLRRQALVRRRVATCGKSYAAQTVKHVYEKYHSKQRMPNMPRHAKACPDMQTMLKHAHRTRRATTPHVGGGASTLGSSKKLHRVCST